ncbi:MAG: FAD-dependent oxidoreductase [Moorea sp. SIO2B7]|nr:FAD-dependent oxidoreductase [Moorena sp. SIO2B7]
MAVISAAREFRRRTSRYPSVLLMSKGRGAKGIGGHLVRGGLAYLDRSQIPLNLRRQLNLETFGDPPALYKEFLRESGVRRIALDPNRANNALQRMRRKAGVDLLTGVVIDSVLKEGAKIKGIQLRRGETYLGKQFIDSTVHAELAQAAGARQIPGFGTFGLPESELSVTLVFETQGLSPARLKEIERIYLRRFTDPNDTDAQFWLQVAAGSDPNLATRLRQDMTDSAAKLKGMYEGNDYIDVRSPALSVAYHSFRGKPFSLAASGSLLDKANIAKLPGNRLIWNCLLFDVNAQEAEALAQDNSQPTAAMLEEMSFVEQWFRSLGATFVKPFSELYIRHAGNITNAVAPLSGTQMLRANVPSSEALGTFGYRFDLRGGIKGLGAKAADKGFTNLTFGRPIFNIGIRHALLRDVPNLAVVSPASGFEGFAAAAGRIVEYNVGVGQGLGIAAIIALLENRNIADVFNIEVRRSLEQTNQLPRIFGLTDAVDVAQLDAFEKALVIRDGFIFS